MEKTSRGRGQDFLKGGRFVRSPSSSLFSFPPFVTTTPGRRWHSADSYIGPQRSPHLPLKRHTTVSYSLGRRSFHHLPFVIDSLVKDTRHPQFPGTFWGGQYGGGGRWTSQPKDKDQVVCTRDRGRTFYGNTNVRVVRILQREPVLLSGHLDLSPTRHTLTVTQVGKDWIFLLLISRGIKNRTR